MSDDRKILQVKHVIYLVNVGANSSHKPLFSPLLPDGRFDFVPIPEKWTPNCPLLPRYMDLKFRWFKTEELIPAKFLTVRVHNDPCFDDPSYGDIYSIRWRGVRLSDNMTLVFYARLKRIDNKRSVFGIIGWLQGEKLYKIREWKREFERLKNPHILRFKYTKRYDRSWVCVGEGELLDRTILFTPELACVLFPSLSNKIREFVTRFGYMRGLGMLFRSVRRIENPGELDIF